VLDEVPQSYSRQRNPKLDQTKYIDETRDHEYMDTETTRLLSKLCAFCEEVHAIMDYPSIPFHIKKGIVKHVELQNVAKTLMD
jgi:hypothetical protein